LNKRLLIIDNTNNFVRQYIVDPSLSRNGQPIGGLQGCLKSLQKLIKETNPDKIIIIWDGPGGSRRRKQIDKNYKEGRKPIKLNWNIDLDEDSQLENKIWQMSRLFEYYSYMPIYQFLFDGIEADDVISYICQLDVYKDYLKVIVSSDKDFIQLLNNKTILYRPAQKEILNIKRVIEKYGIHPNNFLLARAIGSGDKSDNIEGVEGVGLKTVAKRFPFLKEERQYLITDILNVCRETKEKLKVYSSILLAEEKIKQNYSISQLISPLISIQDKHKIDYEIQNKKLQFRKTELLKKQIEDGLSEWNFDYLYAIFNRVVLEQ